MRDRREEILNRLVEIAQTIPGIKEVRRNEEDLSDVLRPAIVIRDGNEETKDIDERVAHRYSIVNLAVLTPDITLIASGNPKTMPAQLATIRMEFLRDVINDAMLKDMCGKDNGNVRYGGCATTDDSGYQLQGQMKFILNITYPLLVDDFA